MAIKKLAGPDQPENLKKSDFLEDFEGFPASKRGPNGYKEIGRPDSGQMPILFQICYCTGNRRAKPWIWMDLDDSGEGRYRRPEARGSHVLMGDFSCLC